LSGVVIDNVVESSDLYLVADNLVQPAQISPELLKPLPPQLRILALSAVHPGKQTCSAS
jgi:hypothetical protein